MALACSKCSTENADGALVCRHCGAALPPPAGAWGRSLLPEDDHFDPLSAPTLVMQHTAPAALPPIEASLLPRPPARDGRRWLLGLSIGVVLVAAGAWLLRPAETANDTEASRPVAAASAAMAASTPVSAVAPPPPASASAAPAATAALPVASAVVAVPAAASALPATLPASAVEGRKRIPEPVARKRAAAAAPAASATAAPLVVAPPPEPVAAPQPAPERPKTVGESCAGGNLITRGFCEQRECRRSEHANDPVCTKLKDAEQRRLFQQ